MGRVHDRVGINRLADDAYRNKPLLDYCAQYWGRLSHRAPRSPFLKVRIMKKETALSQRSFPIPLKAARRAGAAVAGAAATALALSGCFGPSGPLPVSTFQDVESAAVSFNGQGTFVFPGTLNPAEGGWSGSGFVVTADGYVVTNNHVVVGAGTLTAHLGGSSGQQYRAQVLGASECYDLAVVKLDATGLPFLGWYEGTVTNGLEVYSAGFPGDFIEGDTYTLTRGIVSKSDVPLDTEWASLDHVIEHDARIRGGNSGGPLVDANGRVVGVNYAGDDNRDYNLAIHRDEALPILQRLKDGENVGSIGINAQAWVSEDGSLGGIWASSVRAGSPADAIGVEPGDLVYKLAGVSVGTDGTLGAYCQVLETQGESGTIDIQIYRPSTDQLLDGQINGRELTVTSNNVFGGGGTSEGTSGFVTAQDNSGVLQVSVPTEWGEVDGSGTTGPDGSSWASILVAPSISDYNARWDVPGARVSAGAGAMDVQALHDWVATEASSCTATSTGQSYSDGFYTGVVSVYGCGAEGGVQVEVIAAVSPNGGHSIGVFMQLPTQFDRTTVRDEILRTFYASGLPA